MLLLPHPRLGSDRDRSGHVPTSRVRVGVAVAALLIAGCAEPDLPDEVEQTPIDAEEPVGEPEEADELLDQLGELRLTLDEIRDALLSVQEADALPAADGAVERALAALLVDPASDAGEVTPLLPSETVERADSPTAPDMLNATMSVAQDLSGSLGREATDMLRDPIAGDLGSWQRDPAGMVALAEDAAASASELEALEVAILQLDGEGTRALAWTFVARDADDLPLAQGAAERALAHVDLMRGAVDDVIGAA